jgi:exodeoxyribonuclease V alpha subunit
MRLSSQESLDERHMDSETLSGDIEKVVNHSAETGWGVIRVRIEDGRSATMVGSVVRADEGLRVEAEGRWVTHPAYGRQFRADTMRVFPPHGTHGIEKFLASGAIHGVGPHFAKKIVRCFGNETLEVIRHSPRRMALLKGVGPKRVKAVIDGVRDYEADLSVMAFLFSKFGPVRSKRIYEKYGRAARDIIGKNPYRLITDLEGIGFALADSFASEVGMTDEDPQRMRAGVFAALQTAAQRGHTCLTAAECIASVEALLGAVAGRGERALIEGVKTGSVERLERDGVVYYELEHYRWLEERVAERIKTLLMNTSQTWQPIVADRAIPWAEGQVGLQFEEAQAAAIRTALDEKVSVITGGPGVGKTTILRGLMKILRARRLRVLLAAPTGRAARRMAESTGESAETLHKLLDAQPGRGGFQFNAERRLPADAVIVDEASMIEIGLMRSLLEALPDEVKLVLVGDKDQLPSVGPGQVLADLIASGALPVARLERPFRQAAGSAIIRTAHAVNNGEVPDLYGCEPEFQFIHTQDAEETAAAIVETVCERLPEAGYDPRSDVMVLVPMNKGPLGIEALNAALQARINPNPADAIVRHERRFGIGDRVIQRRNDRELGVFNGDVGTVTGIDRTASVLEINFEGRLVRYPSGTLGSLDLAYAITIHRSQGSEYAAVVIGVDTSNSVLLGRQLLYTAMTRGKSRVVLVGQPRAVHISVSEARGSARSTHLCHRLTRTLLSGGGSALPSDQNTTGAEATTP